MRPQIRSLGGRLFEDILALATPTLGRIIHNKSEAGNGEVLFQRCPSPPHPLRMRLYTPCRYGRDDSEFNYSISRYELNCYLIEAAERQPARLSCSYSLLCNVQGRREALFCNTTAYASPYSRLIYCVQDHAISETSDFHPEGFHGAQISYGCSTDTAPSGSFLHFNCGQPDKGIPSRMLRVRCHCPVVACDGGGSRVRYAMRHRRLTSFSEDLLSRGYKEVLFPSSPNHDFGVPGECPGGNGLHIWPRGDHSKPMLLILS